jgi:hypothetical protein
LVANAPARWSGFTLGRLSALATGAGADLLPPASDIEGEDAGPDERGWAECGDLCERPGCPVSVSWIHRDEVRVNNP